MTRLTRGERRAGEMEGFAGLGNPRLMARELERSVSGQVPGFYKW